MDKYNYSMTVVASNPTESVSVSKSTENGIDQYNVDLRTNPDSGNFPRLLELLSSKIKNLKHQSV